MAKGRSKKPAPACNRALAAKSKNKKQGKIKNRKRGKTTKIKKSEK